MVSAGIPKRKEIKMPNQARTMKRLTGAAALVAALGLGAILAFPSVGLAQETDTSTTVEEESSAATTDTSVVEETDTTVADSGTSDETEGAPSGDSRSDRPERGTGDCEDKTGDDASSSES